MRTMTIRVTKWVGPMAILSGLTFTSLGCDRRNQQAERERAAEAQREDLRENSEEARKDVAGAAANLREAKQEATEEIHEAKQAAAEEIQEAQQKARENINEAKQDIHETTAEARKEVAGDLKKVSNLVAEACSGIAIEKQLQCPFDKKFVESVRNVDDGVAVRFSPAAGAPDMVERRVNCYKARVTDKSATGQPMKREPALAKADVGNGNCLLDMANVDVDIERKEDRVVDVEITTKDDGMVTELRRRAQKLAAMR